MFIDLIIQFLPNPGQNLFHILYTDGFQQILLCLQMHSLSGKFKIIKS